MKDYQSLALSYAEELSDLKRRNANLERHCRGLESKLSKTRDRMKMYRERCRAWERALATVDMFHWCFMRDEKPTSSDMAYAVAACAALIRKEVAPTYPSADCAELRIKRLNRAPSTEVEESE
ncbi:hypothetical protein [Collinsella sp. HCP28S3_H5]|uniref:hypothetical protein n=1 Tax=Collinsella sp. HCP28S3_H5 TaxID=3438928 RepID=UPI003F8AF422